MIRSARYPVTVSPYHPVTFCPMSRRILDLGTLQWQLGEAPRQPYKATPADDRSAVREWLPATVPGDIRADLVAA